MDNEVIKLQSSLCDAISKWGNEIGSIMPGWEKMDTYFSDNLYELMASSAFNVMLAQSDLTRFLKKENIEHP